MKQLDSKQKFNIYASFTLSNDDVNVLSLLYTPLMGSDALMLYLSFTSILERNNLKSEELTHQDFFEIYNLKTNDFLKARHKLEGIGLLTSYYDNNSYIYVLCPPLTAKNFIKDATLGLYLYAKVRRETFDYICNHFKIEKIDKSKFENISKSFDEVFDSQIDNDYTYDKFKYILGKKPSKNIEIKDNSKFNFDIFEKEINKDFLDTGITTLFRNQIINLAFVYGFDESEMVNLYNDSINKSNLYDYRLLKKKANVYFEYRRNLKAPKLVVKDEEYVKNEDLISFLDNATPNNLLEGIVKDYPTSYLETINQVYCDIALPRGVLNCMILKVLKEKGELPTFNYFKKVSSSWIKDNIFTTLDAIKYITTAKDKDEFYNNTKKNDDNGGFESL